MVNKLFRLLRSLFGYMPAPLRGCLRTANNAVSTLLVRLLIPKATRRGLSVGGPVIIAGYFNSILGLGTMARLLRDCLRALGYPVYTLNFSGSIVKADLPGDIEDPKQALAQVPDGGTIIFALNPNEIRQALLTLGAQSLQGRCRIGYLAWELPIAPAAWHFIYPYLDEVWGISRFVADSLIAGGVPATIAKAVPLPLFEATPGLPDRPAFAIPVDRFTVLAGFDLRSSAIRKNACGNIAAFQQAFTPDDTGVLLILKVIHADSYRQEIAAILAQLDGWPNIRLLSETLSDTAMQALVASCDVYMSLHRAEGFGLICAEAMLAGKPVIATGWSGNLDFMTATDSCLVPYELVPTVDAHQVYGGTGQGAGQIWAESNINAAAVFLQQLRADPALRATLGEQARSSQAPSFNRNVFRAVLQKTLLSRDQIE